MTTNVLLYNNDIRVGEDGNRPQPTSVIRCEGYSQAGGQLVLAQTEDQGPKAPFVTLEHHALVLDYTGEPDRIKPVAGLMRVSLTVAGLGAHPFEFFATQMVTAPNGAPIFVHPEDAQIKVVYVDPARIASLTHTAPMTQDDVDQMFAQAEEPAEESADETTAIDSGVPEEQE